MPDPISGGTAGTAPAFAPAASNTGPIPAAAPTESKPAVGNDDTTRNAANAASSMAGQATRKVTGLLDGQKEAAADAVQQFAETVRRSGEQFEGQQDWIASAIGRAAEELKALSDSLRDQDVRVLAGHVQTFARTRPTIFIGAAFIAGVAVARFGKLVAKDLSRADLPTIPEIDHARR